MSEGKPIKVEYGNWVSNKLIYAFGLAGFVLLGSAALLFWLLAIPAALFFLVSLYFVYARYEFSSNGGNVQDRVRKLVVEKLDWDGEGRALDIGCGNGALTINLAQKYPSSHVKGIDSWGGRWEYSKKTCEQNAEIEGVNERVTFQKASAVSLPFDDGYFDAVVSNLVFHEVSDTSDKRELIREALRVVKKGGKFAFQDLFLIKRMYGNTDDLVENIKSWGITRVEFVPTRDAEFIPRALKLPFMIGTIGILTGEK